MKKQIIMLALMAMPMGMMAQTQQVETSAQQAMAVASANEMKFGYYDKAQVLAAMTDKVKADNNLAELKSKYDAEMKRSEDDFNARYEEFLDGQRTFAEPILRKRQAELQVLMQKNVEFRQEAERLLAEAKKDAYEPIYSKIRVAARKYGAEHNLAFVINADSDTMPFVNAAYGEDITAALIKMLQ
ncbi:MAG: OmpH family outer membrane protein [Prevotella sp.]|nr:OmpH family outer membrane protein [Prevotella sp.]